MKILNFGSLNIDYVYSVDHFARPGETISSRDYKIFAGGKGGNQSIALVRACAEVWHAGKIGHDGLFLKENLTAAGVHTDYVQVTDGPSGHAVIQVNSSGENAIVLHDGANRAIDQTLIDLALSAFRQSDILLLQNEIAMTAEIMTAAAAKGMMICLNPAPMNDAVLKLPLHLADFLIVNEIEGAALSGEKSAEKIVDALTGRYDKRGVVLTMGKEGVLYGFGVKRIHAPAEAVRAIDTTAAGDTFIGYFLAGYAKGRDIEDCLKTACRAAAICVTREGAAAAIPFSREVERL